VTGVQTCALPICKGIGGISGRVVDNQNIALINVRVSIIGSNLTPATTNETGNYIFDGNVKTGTYDLFYTKLNANTQVDPDYSTYKLTGVSVVEDGTTKNVADVVLDKNFSSLSGVAYLDTNGISGYQLGSDQPIPDITVTANATIAGSPVSSTMNTLPDGSYSLANLRFGSYTLTFVPVANTQSASRGYTALPIVVDVINKNPYTQNINMQAKAGDLYGVVFDDLNGNGIKDGSELPISGIGVVPADSFVTFAPASTTAAPYTTTATGDYEFKNMNPINSYLTIANSTVNLKSYQTKIVYQSVISGQRTKLDIPMRRNTITINGRAIDNDTKNPIQNVNISIGGTTYTAVTGSDGKFSIPNVVVNAAGTTTFNNFLFEADSLGYQQKTLSPSPTSSAGADINLADTSLDKATRKVRGRVVNSDANGVISATVHLIGKPTSDDVTTDSYGYFILETVSVDINNPVDMQITATNYEIAFKSFYLGVGTTRYELSPDITLTSSLAKITGTVIDNLTGGPVSSPVFTVTVGITRAR